MRFLFFLSLIVCICLGVINGWYLPMTQERAKKLMDDYIKSLPFSELTEQQYKGCITLNPMRAYIENFHTTASKAKFSKNFFSDVTLNISRIEFNPKKLIWKGIQEISHIGEIEFEAFLSYEEIERIIADENPKFTKLKLWYEDGHIFIQGFSELLKGGFEFDGTFNLSDKGIIEYNILDIINQEGELVRSKQVFNLLKENLNATISINVMGQMILIENIEILEDGIKFRGKSKIKSDDNLTK